jgi:uncharacterized protein YdcH (DUF465 family)
MAESSETMQDDVDAPGRSAEQQPGGKDGELQEMKLQLLQLRDELIGAEAKLGELREQTERLKAKCRRTEELCELRVANIENELALSQMYEEQVTMMLDSTSWRVGRAIVKPSFALRRTLGIS